MVEGSPHTGEWLPKTLYSTEMPFWRMDAYLELGGYAKGVDERAMGGRWSGSSARRMTASTPSGSRSSRPDSVATRIAPGSSRARRGRRRSWSAGSFRGCAGRCRATVIRGAGGRQGRKGPPPSTSPGVSRRASSRAVRPRASPSASPTRSPRSRGWRRAVPGLNPVVTGGFEQWVGDEARQHGPGDGLPWQGGGATHLPPGR